MCSNRERQLTQQKLCELDRRDLCDKVEEEWEKLSLADSEEVEEPVALTPEKVSEILIEKFPVKKIRERVYNVTDEEIISAHEAVH